MSIQVIATLDDATTVREQVPLHAATTLSILYTIVEQAARTRLNQRRVHARLLANGAVLPNDDTPTSTLLSTVVECQLISKPRIEKCEPLFGSIAGNTHVVIHGSSLAGLGETARVMFGSTSVPCEAINSSMLRCRTPTHEAGVVRVQLIRCEDDEPAVDGDDDDGDVATFEFVRLETAYDRIFATTNSFCPVRSSQQEEDDQMKADATRDPKGRQ